MSTCKDCTYWDKAAGSDYPDELGVGKCKRAKMIWDCTEWGDEELDFKRVWTAEAKNELAFVADGSDYKATLLTRGDFGCVQFESK